MKKIENKIKNHWAQKIIATPDKKVEIFKQVPANEQGLVLFRLSRPLRHEILKDMPRDEIKKLMHYLDPDEVTDLLQLVNTKKKDKIIKTLSHEIKDKVEFLLGFNPKTAAGMMSLDYVEVPFGKTFDQVGRIVHKHEKRTGKFPAILVIDDGFLIGELMGYKFALHDGKETIDKFTHRVPSVMYNAPESEIVAKFKSHPHNKIVVLDEDESIMGVIYSDDILQIIEEKPINALREFAGVSEEEDVLDSAFKKVKHRYKWLIINLGTAFLAASVVSLFEDTISAFVLLAVYMPIIAGMGGNAGTQTLAVTVRGIALKEIRLETGKKVIMNEVLAGLINGLINGVIVAVVATFWNKSPLLGLVLAIAMVFNLMIAGFFGTVIPLIMKKLGKDPASSATIFITTATDVFGFFTFLGLASLVLV
ncbi:magnesium transporter [bacterium]|nr:magnesium transporter [bacterium]